MSTMSKAAASLSFLMPEEACNAHLHIIDPAFPNDGNAASQLGTIDTYLQLANQLRLQRAVFVQAKPFGCDNTCLLNAIERFGAANSRGIAVVENSVQDLVLERLHAGGVRGLRFSVWNPANAVVSFEDCKPLSQRTKHMNWNMQLHMSAVQLLEYADVIRSLDCKVVIDHMGRLAPALGVKDPAHHFICEMIDNGNTWVKLSGPYLNTKIGEPWDDATATAVAIAEYAPQRVVWGSDFPHVTEKKKPDPFMLTEMIAKWLPTEKARQLALVDNPKELYGF